MPKQILLYILTRAVRLPFQAFNNEHNKRSIVSGCPPFFIKMAGRTLYFNNYYMWTKIFLSIDITFELVKKWWKHPSSHGMTISIKHTRNMIQQTHHINIYVNTKFHFNIQSTWTSLHSFHSYDQNDLCQAINHSRQNE